MLKSIKVPMILVRGGSIMLVITAFLHLYLGYPYISKGMSASTLNAGVSADIKAVWLGFCFHLFFIAYLLLISSRSSKPNKSLAVLCGLVVMADGYLISTFIANTFASQLLGLSGMLVLLGSFMWYQFERANNNACI